jgi:hypothetical protein
MIDRIKMYIKDFDFHDIEKFEPYRVGIDKYGAEIWEFKDKNLKFRYVGTTLSIAGSLHKFAHGHNYNTFTYAEMVNVLLYLEEKLRVPLNKFHITSVEVGVNLLLEESPVKYIETLCEYKGNKFFPLRPMSGSSAVKSSVCPMSEYPIVFYDKMIEFFKKNQVKKADRIKYPSNVLRYEVRLSRKQLRNFGLENTTADKLLTRGGRITCLWALSSIMEEIVFVDRSIDYTKIHRKYPKTLHNTVKEYTFVTSDGFPRYLDYLREKAGEIECRKAKKNKANLLKKLRPFLLGKYEKELKRKFAEEISKINDYKRAVRREKV